MPRELAEPWRSFLAELDARVEHEVGLHCCGGFHRDHGVRASAYAADLDVLATVPSDQQRALARFAGRGSTLHQTHGVYLDVVTVATLPDSYEVMIFKLRTQGDNRLRKILR